MQRLSLAFGFSLVVVSVVACDPPPAEGEGEEGEGEEGEGEGSCLASGAPTCTEPTAVACQDESFDALEMNLTDAAPGLIDSFEEDGVFDVDVDARAGGFQGDEGWVYGKFTDEGLVKVELTDFESFESMDWDIGFRRFVFRLNSGFGGPSCVTAANAGNNTSFDDLECAPDGLNFNTESFMSDPEGCELVIDGSGLDAPGVVLQNWWEYPVSCVATTSNVYIIALADGRQVKMVVTQYYGGAGAQDVCNEEGVPEGESARIKLKYAFLSE